MDVVPGVALRFWLSKSSTSSFCRSVAPLRTSYGAVRVPGGALDDDPGIVPGVVLFSGSKAGWCTADEARQVFPDVGPPEFWAGVVGRLFGP